ncbi:hypothetical protein Scep_027978 [Stephania cephalantha]|uniref:Uncharacterized protein n=1 Tax=Stephania cephalantha TaxID=152367 RepID=A0AAP0E916_9MAGN
MDGKKWLPYVINYRRLGVGDELKEKISEAQRGQRGDELEGGDGLKEKEKEVTSLNEKEKEVTSLNEKEKEVTGEGGGDKEEVTREGGDGREGGGGKVKVKVKVKVEDLV